MAEAVKATKKVAQPEDNSKRKYVRSGPLNLTGVGVEDAPVPVSTRGGGEARWVDTPIPDWFDASWQDRKQTGTDTAGRPILKGSGKRVGPFGAREDADALVSVIRAYADSQNLGVSTLVENRSGKFYVLFAAKTKKVIQRRK